MSSHVINHIDQIRSETLELGKQLQEKDAEIQAKYCQVQELNKTLREKDATILNTAARIVELSSGYTALENELQRKDAVLVAREADIRRVSAQLEALMAVTPREDEHCNRLIAENAQLRNLLAVSEADVASSAVKLASAKADANVALDQLRQLLTAAKAEIQRKDACYGRLVADNFNLLQTRYDQIAAAPYVVALQAEVTKEAMVNVQDKTIDRLRRQVADLSDAAAIAQASLSDANVTLLGRQVRLNGLEKLLAERDTALRAANQRITQHENTLAVWDTSLRNTNQQLIGSETLLAERDTALRAANQRINDLEALANERGDRIDALNGIITSRSGQTDAVVRGTEVRGTEVHAEIERLTQERRAQDVTIVTLGRQLDDERQAAQHKHDTLDRARHRAEQDLAALRTSRDTQVALLNAEITQLRSLGGGFDPRFDARWGVPLRGAARTYGRPEALLGPRGGVHAMETSLVLKDNTIRRLEATIATLTTERDALAARITQLSDARSANVAAAEAQVARYRREADALGQQVEQLTKTYRRLQQVTSLDAKAST